MELLFGDAVSSSAINRLPNNGYFEVRALLVVANIKFPWQALGGGNVKPCEAELRGDVSTALNMTKT